MVVCCWFPWLQTSFLLCTKHVLCFYSMLVWYWKLLVYFINPRSFFIIQDLLLSFAEMKERLNKSTAYSYETHGMVVSYETHGTVVSYESSLWVCITLIIVFLRNLSVAHCESSVLCCTHHQSQFSFHHTAKIQFGLQHTMANKQSIFSWEEM